MAQLLPNLERGVGDVVSRRAVTAAMAMTELTTQELLNMRFARAAILAAAFLFSSHAFADGNATAGQKAFSRCASCHATQAGKNGIGPSLAGIVGRSSGTAAGYSYSNAMKNVHLVWDATTLDKYLANPQSVVHGTKMFINVSDPSARGNIIAYLSTLK